MVQGVAATVPCLPGVGVGGLVFGGWCGLCRGRLCLSLVPPWWCVGACVQQSCMMILISHADLYVLHVGLRGDDSFFIVAEVGRPYFCFRKESVNRSIQDNKVPSPAEAAES